ncbi:MAG: hypothetical protein KA187_02020 [Arenimonas sp.]|nr:hypothetical protein [Arenimonas sp.]
MNPAEQEHREHLSAWMDGELSEDQARFLQRRLDADPALRAQFERWQLASACLRGQPLRLQPPAVAQGIAAALASPPARSPVHGRVWMAGAAAALVLALALPQWLARDTGPATLPQVASGPPAPRLLAPADAPLVSAAPANPDDAVRSFPLVLSPERKPWPRSPLAPDSQALDGYLVRHSALMAEGGGTSLLPYVDVVANEPDAVPVREDSRQ